MRSSNTSVLCGLNRPIDRRFQLGQTSGRWFSHRFHSNLNCEDSPMRDFLELLRSDEGQDIAEYAVMLAVILVLVVGTIRLVGSNANNVFSQVGSSLNQ